MNLVGEQLSAQDYVGKSCLAFAGIAKPEGFFAALSEFGFSRIEEMPLADHQEYNQGILNRLIKSCDNHDLIITTEKDAVKLAKVTFPKPCYQVGVELVFDDISPLTKMLDEIVERCR
jgi:tetraacyldisaccharide 4'-kinase